MYEQPIPPKNLWLEQDPLPHAKVDEIYRDNIRRLIKRGSFTEPDNKNRMKSENIKLSVFNI